MPWTPLHAALGETGGDLTFALIERACAGGVPESTVLDWKEQLPLTIGREDREAKERQQRELAKDIAAMANSGGGMIVYGVAESSDPGSSAANHIVPVGVVADSTLRSIRQVAGNLVYPPVVGLTLSMVASHEQPDDAVLVLLIPASPDAPHLVHPANGRDWFGVPYRNGPDTDWMVERQIARSYAAREAGRLQRTAAFEERYDAFLDTLTPDPMLRWVVAVAVPEQPHTRPRDLTPGQATAILQAAEQSPLIASFGPMYLAQHDVTHRGLHRFYREGRQDYPNSAVARGASRCTATGPLRWPSPATATLQGKAVKQLKSPSSISKRRRLNSSPCCGPHTPGWAYKVTIGRA